MDPLSVSQYQAAVQQMPQLSAGRYPRNYTPPPKPDMQQMLQLGKRRFEEQDLYRRQVRLDLQMIRMEMRGIFEDDRADAEARVMDEYESIALRAEFDLAHSWISGLNRRVKMPCRYPGLEQDTRKVQLAATFLMHAEEEAYAERGDLEWRDAVVREYLAKGRVWIFRSINRFADVGESPFLRRAVDPCEVCWDSAGGKVARVWRFYNATWRDIMEAYGQPALPVWRALKAKVPNLQEDSEAPLEVCEYWDGWYRFVTVGGVPLIGVVPHKYGEVPCTHIFSPRGEGFFGRMPLAEFDVADGLEIARWSYAFRTPSFVTYLMREHKQYEASMHRMQHLSKFAILPDHIRIRGIESFGTPFDEFDRQPGAQYEVPDSDSLQPITSSPEGREALAAVLAAQEQDRLKATAPLSAVGVQNDTQATASAQRGLMAPGQHVWKPWARGLDSGDSRDLSKAVRIWYRVGPEAMQAAQGGGKFFVSNYEPRRNEAAVFELVDTHIARAGSRVRVESNSQDPDTYLLKGQAMKLMREQGFTRRWCAEELFSVDFDQSMEVEGFEELAMDQALQHPQFAEFGSVPILMKSWLSEAKGDPDLEAFATAMLDGWMQGVAKKSVLDVQVKEVELQIRLGELQIQQMQIQQMQMTGLPPGGLAPGGAPSASEGSGDPAGVSGGAPGQGGRPEESVSAPTASADYQSQSSGGGSPPQMNGASTQAGVG